MEDEVYHPISRNLFRQSSIETPLSPSIPSDSDSEEEDKNPQQDGRSVQKKSIGKLREQFQNCYTIKPMPSVDETTQQALASNNVETNKVEPKESPPQHKTKAQGKPVDNRKKKTPPPTARSDSLQNKISVKNALLMKEILSHHERPAAGPVSTGSTEKNKPALKSKKPATAGPAISSNCKGGPRGGRPSLPPRSDSLQGTSESKNTMLLNELRDHCAKSMKSKAMSEEVGEDSEPRPILTHGVAEDSNSAVDNSNAVADEGAKTQTRKYDSSKDSVSTIKAFPVMASPRPKSPRPGPVPGKKDEKEESFWEKIGTLGRKKRIKEVQEVQEEGKFAIDSPGLAANPDMPPEDYTLDENEERSMTEPRSLEDPKLQELIYVLIEWINDELADHRIIVKDIAEDLYDGQVLQKLLERLTGGKLDVPEVTQSEEGQKQKLAVVLSAANRVLDQYPPYKWSVDSVHSKNIVSILHLLVGLARQFRAPVRLPERVAIQVVVVRKKDGQLIHRTVREEITSTYEDLGMRCERDAFDTLFDHAPEKLAVVKKSLVTFVNKHLSKVHLEVTELDTQFHDGVFLTLLLGLLEGFFVPLGSFHLTPKTHDQKVHNVSFAFDLMQEIGLVKPKARPEDIVNLDLKSTLRVLYNLFTKYKEIN